MIEHMVGDNSVERATVEGQLLGVDNGKRERSRGVFEMRFSLRYHTPRSVRKRYVPVGNPLQVLTPEFGGATA